MVLYLLALGAVYSNCIGLNPSVSDKPEAFSLLSIYITLFCAQNGTGSLTSALLSFQM